MTEFSEQLAWIFVQLPMQQTLCSLYLFSVLDLSAALCFMFPVLVLVMYDILVCSVVDHNSKQTVDRVGLLLGEPITSQYQEMLSSTGKLSLYDVLSSLYNHMNSGKN